MTTTAPAAANDNARHFYVYQHRRNDTGEVFYVGKGSGNRAWSCESRNRHWNHIVSKYGMTVEILCDGVDEDFAFLLESDIIAKLGRRDLKTGALVNMTDGGDGVPGYTHTPAVRAKISRAFRGKKLSPEHRANISKGQIGKKQSEEHCANMSKARLGKKASAETRDKLSIDRRRRPPTSSNTSGYKGVSLFRRDSKWVATIATDKQRNLGLFATPEEAARAYDAAAIAAWGAGNCYLNFPAEHLQAA